MNQDEDNKSNIDEYWKITFTKYRVYRPKDIVDVCIMYNRCDELYHFVNLTHNHICTCGFKSIEEALGDMNKQISEGKVVTYRKIDVIEIL